MQPTAQLATKITPPVMLPSQAGSKGQIIQALMAPAILSAANAQVVGRSTALDDYLLPIIFPIV
jgi:hypothetical protein